MDRTNFQPLASLDVIDELRNPKWLLARQYVKDRSEGFCAQACVGIKRYVCLNFNVHMILEYTFLSWA